MTHLENTLDALQARFGPLEVTVFRGETTVTVPGEQVAAVLAFLREDPALNYNFLADLTASDDYPEEPRFKVVYQLRALGPMTSLRVMCAVGGEAPALPTVTGVYPSAGWPEREVYDMFGVAFTGHPDLRRILMPADWEGHPLRKDYPLGHEEVQFTFNFDEIDKKKPYARE